MLGVLPGPTAAWAGSSGGSRCPATFDFRCLALFAGYPGLAMDLVQETYGNRSDGCPAADCDCACRMEERGQGAGWVAAFTVVSTEAMTEAVCGLGLAGVT